MSDLIAFAECLAPGTDLLTELQRRRIRLAAPLRSALVKARTSGKQPSEAQRQRWADAARRGGPSSLLSTPIPRRPHNLEIGDYDLIVGLGLDRVDHALAGLEAMVLKVDGDELHLTAPPKTEPIPGSTQLILTQDFALAPGPGRPTWETGTLRMPVELRVDVEVDPCPGGAYQLVTRVVAPTRPLLDAVLELGHEPDGLLAKAYEQAMLAALARSSRELSPRIELPFGPASTLAVRQIDLRTRATARGGAAMIGARIGVSAAASGDPARLVDPFGSTDANLYLRVHEQLIRAVLREAAADERLTSLAKQTHQAAIIEGADLEFHDSEIRLIIDGTLEAQCPFATSLGFSCVRSLQFDTCAPTPVLRQTTKTCPDGVDLAICLLATVGLDMFCDLISRLFVNWLHGTSVTGAITGLAGLVAMRGSCVTMEGLFEGLNRRNHPRVAKARLLECAPERGALRTLAKL